MATPKKKPEDKQKRGRRSLYEPDRHPGIVKMLRATGYTTDEIALLIGVNQDTLFSWANKHPELSESLKLLPAEACAIVAHSLFQRAIGYEYEETKTVISKDRDGRQDTRVEKTRKFALPDTTAQIFWLKNRDPERWADVYEQNVKGKIVHTAADDDTEQRIKDSPEAQEAIREAFEILYEPTGSAGNRGNKLN